MSTIEIIPLASKKAAKRGIQETWIRETVERPAQVVEGYGGRKIAQTKYVRSEKEYLLRVVYEVHEDVKTVLTAYITSKVERYWVDDEN